MATRTATRRGRRPTRLQPDLTRGAWGWNEAGTVWVPPQFAGVDVEVDLFGEYAPIPPAERLAASAARELNACASRGGGKSYNTGRVAAERMHEDSVRIRMVGDLVFPKGHFDRWFEAVVGRPGQPVPLAQERLKKVKAPCPFWVVAPDYDLADIQAQEQDEVWSRWADELGVKLFGRTLWVLGLGIRIDFRSGEKPKKLVGRNLLGVLYEEAARLKPAVFDNVQPALDRRNGWSISNTTPDGKNAYWEQRWARGDKAAAEEAGHPDRYEPPDSDEEAARPTPKRPWRIWAQGCRNVHWTAAENTALPNLAVEMERARKRLGSRSLAYLQNWAASFDTPTGAIWGALNPAVHLRDVDEALFVERVAGYDPGYGRTGFAAGALGFFGRLKDGRWHCYWAMLAQGVLSSPPMGVQAQSTRTWLGIALAEIERVRAHYGQDVPVFIDPSAQDDIAKWVASGIDARPANNHVRGGLATVEELLAYEPDSAVYEERWPHLTFATDIMVEVWRQLLRYRWAQDTAGRNLPWPHKEDDHSCDMTRYAMHSVGAIVTAGGGGQPDEWDPVGHLM